MRTDELRWILLRAFYTGYRNFHVLFAQYERRLISDRTKRALAVKRCEGVRLGRPRSVPDDVRIRVAAMRSYGLSFRAIADVLNAENVPCGQNGLRWWPSTVHHLLEVAAVRDER